jgi:hypothetical protein
MSARGPFSAAPVRCPVCRSRWLHTSADWGLLEDSTLLLGVCEDAVGDRTYVFDMDAVKSAIVESDIDLRVGCDGCGFSQTLDRDHWEHVSFVYGPQDENMMLDPERGWVPSTPIPFDPGGLWNGIRDWWRRR